MKVKNLAVVLARMNSSRLPGKHFELIGGEPMINHCINRLLWGAGFTTVLATSDNPVDDRLAEWGREKGIEVFRGSADDLRLRIATCLDHYGAEYFARVNADSPLIDGKFIEEGFVFLNNSDYDLYTNIQTRSFPYGYSVEVFNTNSFIKVLNRNDQPENVTEFFYKNAGLFKIKNILNRTDQSHFRFTVDTADDLEYFRQLCNRHNNIFELSISEITQLISTQTND